MIVLICFLCEDYEGDLFLSKIEFYFEIISCVLRWFWWKKGFFDVEGDLIDFYKDDVEWLGWLVWKGLIED